MGILGCGGSRILTVKFETPAAEIRVLEFCGKIKKLAERPACLLLQGSFAGLFTAHAPWHRLPVAAGNFVFQSTRVFALL